MTRTARLKTASALALTALLWSCGGVYEALAPEEKRVVDLLLTPDFIRQEDTPQKIDAFVDLDPRGAATTLVGVELGASVEVLASEAGGCDQGALTPEAFQGRTLTRLCLTLLLSQGADVGEREVALELNTTREQLRAVGPFFVLRSLP